MLALLIFIFVSTSIFFFLAFLILFSRPLRIRRRLKELKSSTASDEDEREVKSPSPMRERLRRFNWWKQADRRFRRELKQANLRLKTREFFLILFSSWMFFCLVGYLLSGSMGQSLFFSLIGLMLPFMFVSIRKKQRKKRLEEQLHEMLTITSNSLKAGYSIIQALELLSREAMPPLSEEIQRLVHEMQLGVPMEEALDNMNERIQSKDLDLIITAILIQRQVGGNLANILDNISGTIRDRVRIKAEIRTLTAQGRLSGLIFMVLPVALGLILYLMNREYILLLFTDRLGWVMLGMAAVGQILGAYFIRKIVRIDL